MPIILLIEDSRFLRLANERLLSKAGYQVICAGDGEEALKILETSRPDLVLLDMLLPKLGGPEVLRALKGNAETRNIPIIVLTSLSQKNEQRLKAEGAAAFFEKSMLLDRPDLLLSTIQELLCVDGFRDILLPGSELTAMIGSN